MRPRLSLRRCWGGRRGAWASLGRRRSRRCSVTHADGAGQGQSRSRGRLSVIPTFSLKSHTWCPVGPSGCPRPWVTFQVASKRCPKNTGEPDGKT